VQVTNAAAALRGRQRGDVEHVVAALDDSKEEEEEEEEEEVAELVSAPRLPI